MKGWMGKLVHGNITGGGGPRSRFTKRETLENIRHKYFDTRDTRPILEEGGHAVSKDTRTFFEYPRHF